MPGRSAPDTTADWRPERRRNIRAYAGAEVSRLMLLLPFVAVFAIPVLAMAFVLGLSSLLHLP